jgi:hypothetical protein
MNFPIPEASLTSSGLTEAACTLMRSSSGFEIWGVGIVATWYSFGLQYLESANARMVRGMLPDIVVLLYSCFVEKKLMLCRLLLKELLK